MGRKRNRSLFELMDPKGVYRVPDGMSNKDSEQSEEPEPKQEVTKPAVKAVKKTPADEAGQENPIEPFVAADEGKIRLVMNYPLAIMLGFVVVILLLCAVLIGWRLGRDSAAKIYLNAPKQQQVQPGSDGIDKSPGGWE